MVCGGFSCSKNALAALNILYILVSFILIGVAAYGKAIAIVTDIKIVAGIIICGVLLLLIAIIGLVGAVKHHQVLLFFYMVVLFLLFLIQFSIACACLAVNDEQKKGIAKKGWQLASTKIKDEVQKSFSCCGFEDANLVNTTMGHPGCQWSDACRGNPAACCTGLPDNTTKSSCPITTTCWNELHDSITVGLRISGGIGLFFSFTEIVGVWLALRFRNQKDPSADPSQFL